MDLGELERVLQESGLTLRSRYIKPAAGKWFVTVSGDDGQNASGQGETIERAIRQALDNFKSGEGRSGKKGRYEDLSQTETP